MSLKVTGNCPEKEKINYILYLEKKYNRKLKSLDVMIDDEDYANLTYEFEPVPFDRIRRITGYLTGTLDTWNNSKRAEEADRVKHSMPNGMERL